MSELLFRFREPLSAVGSAIVMLLLLLLFHSLAPTVRHPVTTSAPIELTLSASESQHPIEQQAAPPLMVVPAIQRNLFHKVVPTKEPMNTAQTAAAPIEPATQIGAAHAMPDLASPLTQEAPASHGLANSFDVPSVAPVDSGRNAEVVYASKVRAYLQTVKRYPTGREASLQRPTGISVVWFIVRRNGELIETEIETSSGSMLL